MEGRMKHHAHSMLIRFGLALATLLCDRFFPDTVFFRFTKREIVSIGRCIFEEVPTRVFQSPAETSRDKV